jgi:hypothetical protein
MHRARVNDAAGLRQSMDRQQALPIGERQIDTGLAHIALIRRDELDSFVEGLFGGEESLELPERAHRAIETLSELRGIFDGLHELVGNPAKPASLDDIRQTHRNVRELTKIGEREIHEVVLACTRARGSC